MSGFRIEIVTGAERLSTLIPEWRDLWARAGATPFQSPDWLVPWWDVFMPGELRIVTVRNGATLTGIAPLYREDASRGPRLLPLGISLSDYLDVIFDSDRIEESASRLAEALKSMDDVAECEFPELPPDALALRIPPPEGWDSNVFLASVCPVLSLPQRADELNRHVPPSRLRHLRTARRRAARRRDCAIIEGDADNAEMLLAELVRLHTLRWERAEEPGVFADSRVAEFHAAALTGLMERGLARFYALQMDGKITGVYYGFVHDARAYAYLCGYDPAFAFESPGAILLGHAIEEAVRQGAREFHFLRGRESYKYEWGAADRQNRRRVLTRSGARR